MMQAVKQAGSHGRGINVRKGNAAARDLRVGKALVPVTTSGNAEKRAAKRLLFRFGKGFGGHIWRKARFPNDRLRQQARQNACRQRQQGNGRKLADARIQPRQKDGISGRKLMADERRALRQAGAASRESWNTQIPDTP